MITTHYINFETKGENDAIDLTEKIKDAVKKICKGKIKNGLVTVFAIGSTCAITTIEYEKGLVEDFVNVLKKIDSYRFKHDLIDSNGKSHVKASLIKPSVSLILENGNLVLGNWQQIVFLEFDVRPRKRRIALQIIGEK